MTVCYDLSMDKMLTLRLGKEQDVALTRRAKAIGKTRSAVVRDLIDKALADRPMRRRVGHLKGRVELPRSRSGWRRDLKDRNWR
jgi:Flp pilus assembly CpaF family ATPase